VTSRDECGLPGAGNVLVMTPDQSPVSADHIGLADRVRRVLPAARADLERLVRIRSVSADPDAVP